MDILITRITATEWQFSPLLQNLKLLLFNGVSGSCVNVTTYNIFYCYCFSKKDVIIAYFTHQLKSCQRISLGLSVALFWLGNCQKISSRKRHAPMCDPFFHLLLCQIKLENNYFYNIFSKNIEFPGWRGMFEIFKSF